MSGLFFSPAFTDDNGESKLCGCKMEVGREDTRHLVRFITRCEEHAAMTEEDAHADIWARLDAQAEALRAAENGA